MLWWGAPGWAMTGALAAALWRRPLPPPAVAALVAAVAAAGLWLVDGAPPLQWGRVLPEPYFEAPALFLAAVSGGTLLYYVLVWGWPGPNLYRVALTALLAALVLGGQVLVFRQALAVQNAAAGKTFGPDFRVCWETALPGPPPQGDLGAELRGETLILTWGSRQYFFDTGTCRERASGEAAFQSPEQAGPRPPERRARPGRARCTAHPRGSGAVCWLCYPEDPRYLHAEPLLKTRGPVVAAQNVWGPAGEHYVLVCSSEPGTNTLHPYLVEVEAGGDTPRATGEGARAA